MSVLAEKAFTTSERLEAYDNLKRVLVPAWQLEFAKSKQSMTEAIPGAINGSLRDLATFILAAKANENAQVSLLSAEKIARDTHPMSKARFGT